MTLSAQWKKCNIFMSVISGFRREGVRRRAFWSQTAGEWKDVTYLAILATEWIYDHSNLANAKILPSNLWDEVFSRHQREQEEIIRMEERKTGTWPGCLSLKRSSSLETIREAVPNALSVESGAESTGFTTDTSSSSSAASSSKRRKFASNILKRGSFQSSSESGFESEWDMASVAEIDDAEFFSSVDGTETGPSFVRFARRPQSGSRTWDFL
jgi:hypothetical protein